MRNELVDGFAGPARVPALTLQRARRGARVAHAVCLSLVPVLLVGPGHLAAQDVEELSARCASSGSASSVCAEAALALQAAQGGMGLLAAGGTQLPGASSTLGRRFGGMPRLSGSVRGGLAFLDVPDVRSAASSSPGRGYTGLATQASLAAGILDGFSLIPTVGGVLSLDLFATAGVIMLPEGDGFQDGSSQWGVGANIGLLRESFTMPGVSVAIARRSMGETRLGDRASGDVVEITLDPSVTSVRGVVGKDLLALGVVAGIGWDRYTSDATIVVPGSGSGIPHAVTAEGFSADRMLAFGGVSLSLLVLQISAEGGLAKGFDAVPGRSSGGYDPEGSSLFLSIAGRLTL